MLKGILDPRDAVRAVESGVDAVVVSNHGGRQLDGAAASIVALPGVVDAVGDRCEVLLDGGIRSGTDILRALALGANGVLVGRPMLYGLAVDGARGAGQVLSLLATELRRCADARRLRRRRGGSVRLHRPNARVGMSDHRASRRSTSTRRTCTRRS